MNDTPLFFADHETVTRRFLLRAGAAGAALGLLPRNLQGDEKPLTDKPEPFFTTQEKFRDVSRGKPLPHKLPDEQKKSVGLTRETWRLEVIADPEKPAKIGRPLTKEAGSALDFPGLLELGKKHAVRFPKVMTCLNIGCPLGMGIWEGVPLREVVWRTDPRENLRRVFYYGYHNDDPKQMFRSSLPIGRVLEDTGGLPPIILCYKLNGHWLTAERGGPVRVVVPEAYGFKSIKWVTHVVLSNIAHANDTYSDGNNDVDSPLKTFAATLSVPTEAKAGQPLAVTGYAQVGISGLKRVQAWISPAKMDWPDDDPYYTRAAWVDAEILGPPKEWGGDLPEGKIPPGTRDFDDSGRPRAWPLRLGKAHWAVMLPGLPAGDYTLRCRTIDGQGQAQPMPRPFRKSGHAAIEEIRVRIA